MKPCRILWSSSAISHFSSWIRYISRDSVAAAERQRKKILRAAEQLSSFPRSGRVVPEFNNQSLREVIQKPIRIIYELKNKEVHILAMHHSSRQLDQELFEAMEEYLKKTALQDLARAYGHYPLTWTQKSLRKYRD